jgi:hypothetical protein
MNSRRFVVLSVLLFGSLWGLVELGIGELAWVNDVPRAPILTAFGVLFMVLARSVWSVPGSTLALAAVASAYKVLQHPVWGCKLAAVVVVGAIFEAGFTLYERRAGNTAWSAAPVARSAAVSGVVATASSRAVWPPVALAMAMTFVSFVLFGYFAKYVLLNPYWMAADKLLDYQFVQGPVATLLAAPAAWAGLALGARLSESRGMWGRATWIAYRAAAVGSGIAAAATAVALRY